VFSLSPHSGVGSLPVRDLIEFKPLVRAPFSFSVLTEPAYNNKKVLIKGDGGKVYPKGLLFDGDENKDFREAPTCLWNVLEGHI
jgi:hypothetical protein